VIIVATLTLIALITLITNILVKCAEAAIKAKIERDI